MFISPLQPLLIWTSWVYWRGLKWAIIVHSPWHRNVQPCHSTFRIVIFLSTCLWLKWMLINLVIHMFPSYSSIFGRFVLSILRQKLGANPSSTWCFHVPQYRVGWKPHIGLANLSWFCSNNIFMLKNLLNIYIF